MAEFEKYRYDLLIRSWDRFILVYISSTGPLVSAAWMGTVLLSFGLFLSHTGAFTQFLHRIASGYFIFSLCAQIHSDAIRAIVSKYAFIEIVQEDSIFFRLFFFYSTSLLILFFFGRSTRFIFSKRAPREFALLILFIHLGGLFVFRFTTFIDIFLGLEIITLGSYVLVSFERHNRFSTYSAIQYFLIGSIPSGRLLLGFSFFYLQSGSLVLQDLDLFFTSIPNSFYTESGIIQEFYRFPELNEPYNIWNSYKKYIVRWISRSDDFYHVFSSYSFIDRSIILSGRNHYTSISIRGFCFILFNLFFKLTAAPFHFWAPSVYGKAPIASVAFLSIYSKVRVLFFLFYILTGFLHFSNERILFFFLFSGLFSIFIGRVGAFTEKRIKRFFVFSSRGHVGFRLAGYSLSTFEGYAATFHYLPVYRLSSLLRWFILHNRRPGKPGYGGTFLIQFSTLKNQSPLLALYFAVLLFSRSGIPPFAGFFVKLDILSALFDSSYFFINYIFFFFTVASFFYYLRAIKILFFDQASPISPITGRNGNNLSSTTLSSKATSTILLETPRSSEQYWLRSILFLFLIFYFILIQKPLFLIQNDRLLTRILYLDRGRQGQGVHAQGHGMFLLFLPFLKCS